MRLNQLLAFVAFAATSASAVPFFDFSHTSVDVDATRHSLKSDSPRFTLTVHRTDDLVDETAGTLVAERQTEIKMNFDVASTGDENSLLLNGVPVQAGLEAVEIQVHAEMAIKRSKVTLPDGTISHEKEENVKSAFDVGLVKVQVFVQSVAVNVQLESFLPPVPIRRFSLVEKVIEINGKSVIQTDIGTQVFYFGPGGEFVGIVDDAQWNAVSQKEEVKQSTQISSIKCRMARVRSAFASWFKSLPSILQFLIALAWVSVGALWGLFLSSQIVRLFSGRRRVSADVEQAMDSSKVAYSYEKVKELEQETASFGDAPKYDSSEEKIPGGGDSENDKLCK